MNPDRVFAEPLIDLSADNAAFAGIFTPCSSAGHAKRGVTSQFLENAAEYHRNYLNVDYWGLLLDNALTAAGVSRDPGVILDIGSGSGNSVIPLLRRFADAQIAAILHHVPEPERVLASCQRALKPGCWAMFFEPFEAGNTLIKLTYQRILAQVSPAQRAIEAMRLLERMVADYTMRTRPKTDPILREIDDKWMFTRTYFERIKAEQGWAELNICPLNVSATFLRTQAEVHLRLGAQLEPAALPDWAWAVIDETDAGASEDLRQEWAPEAAVLLRKASAA